MARGPAAKQPSGAEGVHPHVLDLDALQLAAEAKGYLRRLLARLPPPYQHWQCPAECAALAEDGRYRKRGRPAQLAITAALAVESLADQGAAVALERTAVARPPAPLARP